MRLTRNECQFAEGRRYSKNFDTGRVSRSGWNDDERLLDNMCDFCRLLKMAGLEFARSKPSLLLKSGSSSMLILDPSETFVGHPVPIMLSCGNILPSTVLENDPEAIGLWIFVEMMVRD